jgi:hypothetical protein
MRQRGFDDPEWSVAIGLHRPFDRDRACRENIPLAFWRFPDHFTESCDAKDCHPVLWSVIEIHS